MAESAVFQGVVRKIVEYSEDAIKKQVRYLCCYSCNVQTLADEVGELNIKHQSLQQRVDAALANSEVITPEVEAWVSKVEDLKIRSDKICSDAEEVKRSFLCKWFPVLHYSLSRKALKTTNDSVQLRNIEFPIIATFGIPADIPPVPTTSIVGFESRDFIEDGIVDALKDSSVYSIGIWGIGGVGKTTMAKQIEKKVRDEKYFKRVVMVVVSQQPDLPKIQSQIAEGLGLSLTEESLVLRQRKIHHRLVDEKSILIILDDIWDKLNLEEIGIPSQSTHVVCKLILTSRNLDALTSTGVPVQCIFQLEILTEEESWRFFKDNADINIDDDSQDELVQIAKKVERECMGLPLALKTVACALKGKSISFWNNAVRELEKHLPDDIPGVVKEVYGSLQFSINALEGKNQKDLFLLCCLFPEDYFISIEELLRCVMGLGIFKELENLTEARDKVETVLNILLSRSLLIKEEADEDWDEGDGEWDEGDEELDEGNEEGDNFNVTMHDIIRDVGIWIATKGIEQHIFLIKHWVNEWPRVEDDNYTCISLLFSHHGIIFPESIVFPKLEFLRLEFSEGSTRYGFVELPENFFNRMSELRVFEAFNIGLLPPSMGQLNNLRTLYLKNCTILERVLMLGKLINLEMLSLIDCKLEVLPTAIGGLKNLKQMDISGCISLKRIEFGVVSGLTKLEELVIWDSFGNWEAEGEGEEDVACISELNGLKNLTTLKIEIRNPSVVPKQKPLWVQKLKKYGIIVSNCYSEVGKRRFQKAILLGEGVANPLEDWIYNMASDAEYVNLEGCNCMKFVKGLSENSGNLICLKQLRLSHFTSIQYLVEGLQNSAIFTALESLHIEYSDTLQQIFEVSPQTGSFEALQSIHLIELSGLVCLWKFSIKEQLYLHNLQEVEIESCDNLLYLFSLSVIQSLVQLTSLGVRNCQTIKEIFKKENGELEEINEIKLPKLREINFVNLDSFYGLCSEIRIELPELHELNINYLPRMKMADGDSNEVYQKYLISKVDNVQVTWISINFYVLRDLTVNGIGNFKCIFSPSVIFSGLPNLRNLFIIDCSMLEEVIEKDNENVGRTIIFPNLDLLHLSSLPNIRTFCYNAVQFPSLRELHVVRCQLMLKFVEGLTDHISSSKPFLDKQVQCPQLERLILEGLNISGVFSPLFFKSLTILRHLELSGCERLEQMITKEEGSTTTNTEEEFIQKIPLVRFNLIQMPKLCGSIFQIKHNLEFPLLEDITIKDIPKLEKFSLGSVHLPKLKSVRGLLSAKSVAIFFSNNEMVFGEIHPENNCFIISPKDITFSSNQKFDCLVLKSSGSFVDVVSIALDLEAKEIVGKFKIEKIRIGIEYEVMLMIMLLDVYVWKHPIEIELKLPAERKLQHTVILENHPKDTWIEISIGKFVGEESQQNEQLEFSLCQSIGNYFYYRRRWLYVGGIRIVEV